MSPGSAKTVKAKEFVSLFRKKPDDVYLMEQYSITVKQLAKIYSAVIEKGLLSEYEYHQRERKAPELQDTDLPPVAASVTVRVIEEPSEALTERMMNQECSTDAVLERVLREARETQQQNKRRRTQPKQREVITLSVCPGCHKPKDKSSPDECVYCGLVFSKGPPKKERASIWYDD